MQCCQIASISISCEAFFTHTAELLRGWLISPYWCVTWSAEEGDFNLVWLKRVGNLLMAPSTCVSEHLLCYTFVCPFLIDKLITLINELIFISLSDTFQISNYVIRVKKMILNTASFWKEWGNLVLPWNAVSKTSSAINHVFRTKSGEKNPFHQSIHHSLKSHITLSTTSSKLLWDFLHHILRSKLKRVVEVYECQRKYLLATSQQQLKL